MRRNSPFPSKVYMQINPHRYGGFYLFLLAIYHKIGDDGAGGLHECWRSAQRWLASISDTIGSAMPGEGSFELRGVVKPLGLLQ